MSGGADSATDPTLSPPRGWVVRLGSYAGHERRAKEREAEFGAAASTVRPE